MQKEARAAFRTIAVAVLWRTRICTPNHAAIYRVSFATRSGSVHEAPREGICLRLLSLFGTVGLTKRADACPCVQKLGKYTDRGDESKVKELTGKSEVSFADFAAAFKHAAVPQVRTTPSHLTLLCGGLLPAAATLFDRFAPRCGGVRSHCQVPMPPARLLGRACNSLQFRVRVWSMSHCSATALLRSRVPPACARCSCVCFGRMRNVAARLQVEGEGNCLGFAAKEASGSLVPWKFNRRALRDDDVKLKITYAGVCHSDVHQVKDEWGNGKCAVTSLVPLLHISASFKLIAIAAASRDAARFSW